MVAGLQAQTRSLAVATPLEAVLGRAQGRYFGAGYRNVQYALTQTYRRDGSATGLGRVHYPTAWSTNAAGATREAHLSSIDAVLLSLALLEATMTHQEYRDAGRMRITRLHLVAGSSPFMTLGAVPIRLDLQAAEDGHRVHAVAGNIKVGLNLSYAPEINPVVDLRESSPTAQRCSVYSALFRTVENASWIRHAEEGATRLSGDHVLTTTSCETPDGGFEASYWPAPTLIDYLVVMGQLTQALVYSAAGRQRATSGPLWMRTIDITVRSAPAALPARFHTGIQLLRDRSLQRGGVTLHDCKVEASASTDVSAIATLAYQEQ